jgi:hypothetical protein
MLRRLGSWLRSAAEATLTGSMGEPGRMHLFCIFLAAVGHDELTIASFSEDRSPLMVISLSTSTSPCLRFLEKKRSDLLADHY